MRRTYEKVGLFILIVVPAIMTYLVTCGDYGKSLEVTMGDTFLSFISFTTDVMSVYLVCYIVILMIFHPMTYSYRKLTDKLSL